MCGRRLMLFGIGLAVGWVGWTSAAEKVDQPLPAQAMSLEMALDFASKTVPL